MATGNIEMSKVARKPVFVTFDQVPHKPGCTNIEDCFLQIYAKTKVQISCAVTMQVISVFVFGTYIV